ncbi:hypothetical protein FCM35_KLT21670 [Carex littledalei]|uniref:Uncharacterized protein n=1 Tax=Carex littledalei TaxID=544730 RepID=A0A833VDM9_9POAL|nr:hypothetical protein FCM35_KLT21670 [Carex littledalei]
MGVFTTIAGILRPSPGDAKSDLLLLSKTQITVLVATASAPSSCSPPLSRRNLPPQPHFAQRAHTLAGTKHIPRSMWELLLLGGATCKYACAITGIINWSSISNRIAGQYVLVFGYVWSSASYRIHSPGNLKCFMKCCVCRAWVV